MSIRVALYHQTEYTYDRLVSLGPQIVRLRPAPHCRTPITSYSLKVDPHEHFINWQQDPHGNFLARLVFPKPTRRFNVQVDLVAEMTVINPFDFFVEPQAEKFPFLYEPWLEHELRPFLESSPLEGLGSQFLATIDRSPRNTVDFLVELNQKIQRAIAYRIRLEPGVQTPEQTLQTQQGSCRDSAWLLVQMLRHLGIAARFVSGYLMQLAPDVKSLDGPSGPEEDFTDLHAWTEAFVPGAGWIGLDPTSGLLAGEGHIPLACTPEPNSAAPISGAVEKCEVQFDHSMRIVRIHEDPRVTKPYTEEAWTRINRLGNEIDRRLRQGDVRLTMGGEPTFVSIDDMDGAEWTTGAVGPHKRILSEMLIKRLRKRFAPGGLLHYGQGKWYPGESLPRWALACFWRRDGVAIWRDESLIANTDCDYGYGIEESHKFARYFAKVLQVPSKWITPAYEDIAHYLWKEQRLPINVVPQDSKLKDPEQRARLARVFERGVGEPCGLVMPLQRQWWQGRSRWTSGPWPVRSEKMFLLPGDSPIGLRLPLDSLPWVSPQAAPEFLPVDPVAAQSPLPAPPFRRQAMFSSQPGQKIGGPTHEQRLSHRAASPFEQELDSDVDGDQVPTGCVRTAICFEPRDGKIHAFMPPVESAEDFLELISALEITAIDLQMPIVIEGYLPPADARLNHIKVTPDPGVIEVNIHPSENWDELVSNTTGLYEEAHWSRLGTEKFDLDGKHTGTGGGNHVVLGGPTPADSPLLRRPDLLRSLIGYWVNHPSLSYLFSGRFIGPTSQAPRVDEGRRDALYELELAFSLVPARNQTCPPWLVDRLFRNLLIDLTGNTHRAEFCIDKLYSPDSSSGRLGLLEFRGFEMPPHARMSLTQQLLIRALIVKFWETPYDRPLIDWGTTLHDRFMLPHFIWRDFAEVVDDLNLCGLSIEKGWFAPHFEFRFPKIGEISIGDIHLDLRSAIEPWYVLGEEPGGGGTVRFVDSSVERLQVEVSGMVGSRYVVTCGARRVPLHATGIQGQYVGGVRYRAWAPPSALHPTIGVHTPLVFDILDTWSNRSLGGCTYHVAHPAGRNYQTFPVNAYEAEARRAARFFVGGHTPGPVTIPPAEINPAFPMTLDLRRAACTQ